jgi:hypothetical protein
LLIIILGLLTGVYGAARVGAKVASQLPRLAEYAKAFRLKRSTARASTAKGEALTPSQLRKQAEKPPVSTADDKAPVKVPPRKYPYGFKDEAQYRRAMNELNEALKKSGIDDANIGTRGSAVSGISSKGGPFRIDTDPPLKPSDIDVFIESKKLTDGIKTSANIPGFAHPERVMDKYPALREWSNRWSSILGREITPGGFRPGTVPTNSPTMPFGG